MAKPFDATLKDLGADHAEDFVTTFDAPPQRPVRPLNVDLSTVTTAADLVVGLDEPLAGILHFDFQAGPDADKGLDVAAYNVLLHRLYRVPVHSILVLLCKEAKHSAVTGQVSYAERPGRGRMEFTYEVVRLWERPAEELLAGPVGTLPLSVLGRLRSGVKLTKGLRAVVECLAGRLEAETDEGERKRLLTSAFVLSGLRLEPPQALEVFRGVQAMKESTTYQMILNEGIEKGIEKGRKEGIEEGVNKTSRAAIVNLGQDLHGKLTAAARKKLDAITDAGRLERILNRVVKAKGWDDLLATP
jgi:predicted transposase YdaD